MTAKEKADELMKKFNSVFPQRVDLNAQSCAIICVEEIMQAHPDVRLITDEYVYWNEVLTHLKK